MALRAASAGILPSPERSAGPVRRVGQRAAKTRPKMAHRERDKVTLHSYLSILIWNASPIANSAAKFGRSRKRLPLIPKQRLTLQIQHIVTSCEMRGAEAQPCRILDLVGAWHLYIHTRHCRELRCVPLAPNKDFTASLPGPGPSHSAALTSRASAQT